MRDIMRDTEARVAGFATQTRTRRIWTVGAVVTLLVGSAGFARAQTLTVDFGSFPKGLDCAVSGTSGKVTVRSGREVEYKVRGDVAGTTFVCTLPDGRVFRVVPGAWYVPGSRMTAVQINADGPATILSDAGGGMTRETRSDVLDWQN